MKFYDENKKQLKDKKIVAALKRASKDYEDGAIVEVYDELCEIIMAIDVFVADGEH